MERKDGIGMGICKGEIAKPSSLFGEKYAGVIAHSGEKKNNL
jgi:hypothetical protein